MLVSNCRSSCGNDGMGDQSGNEWRIQSYWDYPWDCVLRHPNVNIRCYINNYARHGALNDHCGYSMTNGRTSFWNALRNVRDFDPANITFDCNADCSSSTASIIKAVGCAVNDSKLKNIEPSLTTHTMREALAQAGFMILPRLPEDSIRAGDILLNIANHVCIAVADSDYALVKTNCNEKSDKLDLPDTNNTTSNNFHLTGEGRAVAGIQGILVYCGYDVGRYRDKRGISSGIDGDAGGESSMTNNALKIAIDSGKLTEDEVKSILELLGDK